MLETLKDKNVFLTGASGGIGKELALQFASAGCNLFLTGRDDDKLVSLVNQIFKINPNISCFDLERYTTNIQQILWNHWEYHSYLTPIWKERFDKYEIQINSEEHSIEFKKEDEEIDIENI